jgi:hypothetical protein
MRSRALVCLTLALMLAACKLTPAATALPTAAVSPEPSVEPDAATVVGSETPTSQPVEQTRQPSIPANEMYWETSGGGQIMFAVTRSGPNYDVAVSSYQFEDRENRFTITADSGDFYGALSDVMRDQGGIRLVRSDAPGGSWTTLRFSDSQDSSTYKDVIVEGDLRIIYDYVVAQIEPV